MVVAVDWFWVTDNERIEQVVYDLRRAVQNSDVEGVLKHMAPNVQYLQGETALRKTPTRALIQANLSQTRFEFVRISDLQTSAGQQSRRGKAEFRVFTRGRSNRSAGDARWSHNLVAGFPGDRAGRLEGEPDQSRLDAPGDPGSPRWITADRRVPSRPQRWNRLPSRPRDMSRKHGPPLRKNCQQRVFAAPSRTRLT